MARAARMIGDAGVIGQLLFESVDYPDPSQPTLAYTTIQYKPSLGTIESCNLVWFTTMTQAEVRSAAKDAIRQDIIDKLGITIPKAQIKMLNSPE